jgi:hypothetical protein
MKTVFFQFLIVLGSIIMTQCNNAPKAIQPTASESPSGTNSGTGIFEAGEKQPNSTPTTTSEIHQIEVLEVLPTDKYIYLKVSEGEEVYWIATGKQEVQVGQSYFYKNGLLKTQFHSKEYDRTFDKIYLVSNIVPSNHGSSTMTIPTTSSSIDNNEKDKNPTSLVTDGSVSIANLVANPESYKDQTIQISGRCAKLNANIMGRNWIHLKDGTKDDYDLVVTSNVPVPEGHVVTMKGVVRLDKDFGAGYRYDIIIEDGELQK